MLVKCGIPFFNNTRVATFLEPSQIKIEISRGVVQSEQKKISLNFPVASIIIKVEFQMGKLILF